MIVIVVRYRSACIGRSEKSSVKVRKIVDFVFAERALDVNGHDFFRFAAVVYELESKFVRAERGERVFIARKNDFIFIFVAADRNKRNGYEFYVVIFVSGVIHIRNKGFEIDFFAHKNFRLSDRNNRRRSDFDRKFFGYIFVSRPDGYRHLSDFVGSERNARNEIFAFLVFGRHIFRRDRKSGTRFVIDKFRYVYRDTRRKVFGNVLFKGKFRRYFGCGFAAGITA